MAEVSRWVWDNLLEPEGPGIAGLEDTYHWKRFFIGMNHSKLFQALFPNLRGVIFTGPAGNGRSTQAKAFAYSLLEQNLIVPDNFAEAKIVIIEPILIPPEQDEKELIMRVIELYETLDNLMQMKKIHTAAIIFDQIHLYPRSFMDQIAEYVLNQEAERLFTICIGEAESGISRNLMRELQHCRCPNPTAEQRGAYLKQLEEIPVEDTWSVPSEPRKKHITVTLDGITWDEVISKTEGCSYANLKDLVRIIKLAISNYDVEQFGKSDRVVICVSREDVLEAIRLCRAADGEEHPMRIFTVAQQNNCSPAAEQNEESSVEDDINYINSMF